ncbi:unnamed protein product [Ophioblennius macclurei]
MSYGSIMSIRPSGASSTTSRQDNLQYSGVRASETMAETDASKMEMYRSKIKRVGNDYGIEPALIAGIISRESRAGAQLVNGRGDYGKAFGLMQVDTSETGGRHKARGAWDSEEHLCQGTEILIEFIEKIQRKFPDWSQAEQLQGGIDAYNMGDQNVHGRNVDANTTGGDYSNDVVARARYYKKNHSY